MLQPLYDEEFDTDENLLRAFKVLQQVDSRGYYADSNFAQLPQPMAYPIDLNYAN